MNSDFYQKFESIFRGSRELIKQRLKIYEDFLTPFSNTEYGNVNAIDLGCGRGEWLEFLDEMGIKSIGVDLDSEMLKDCIKRNQKVFNFDAIEYLKNTATESIQIISAFHLIEHISFQDLQLVFKESMRVLKPGGLLILETPNSENISVATNSFYLDPTHIKPIPHDLIMFMAQYYGFFRVKIIGVNQVNVRLEDEIKAPLMISDLIYSVCPDYALIAQKASTSDDLKKFDNVFDRPFGILKLRDLIKRYEVQEYAKFNEVEILKNKIDNLERSLFQIHESLNHMQKNFLSKVCLKFFGK